MKLPVPSGLDVIKALSKKGFVTVGRKGSHVRLKNMQTRHVVTVPMYNEIAPKVLLSIIKQSGMEREEFIKLLY